MKTGKLRLIAGVDEAGRGPLAGPVFSAAVILDANAPIEGLADSKKLSAKKREYLALQIKSQALSWSIAQASVEEIDSLNILQATLLAMRRAVEALPLLPDEVLVDGNQVPKLTMPVQAIVRGDESVAAISAASILAKTARDALMCDYALQFTHFSFDKHKGYGTKQHLREIAQYAILPVHRKSFNPIKNPAFGTMTRIALCIEYDGSRFLGWQAQNEQQRSVQHTLQTALEKIAQHPITLHGAGRTDTGVHALAQIAHFDSFAQRPMQAWQLGTNSHLPDDVRILWAKEVAEHFHARFSALARGYRYVILNRPTASALFYRHSTWQHLPLCEQKMHESAQHLIGELDFSAFRAAGCQSRSPVRQMHFIDVFRQGEQVIIELCANAFLHHMVRNIVGVLIDIGTGKRAVDWTKQLLDGKDRTRASATASASGLYFVGVCYRDEFGLEKNSIFDKLPATVQRFD